MRKLDKTNILSSVYKAWEAQLQSGQHPKYNSSEGEYYIDIIMNLLHIQQGVCAYTEKFICSSEKIASSNWTEGRYNIQNIALKEIIKGGNLDHFNPNLKSKKGATTGIEDWSWDNFFFIDTDVNNRKLDKEVDNILKPDHPDYDEKRLLEYDFDQHRFIANTKLSNEEQKRVNNMILVLGINLVTDERGNYLNEKKHDKKLGHIPLEKMQITQYFTAFAMSKAHFETTT